MSSYAYTLIDFQYIAAGAAILASGGGGGYCDAISVLDELAAGGWSGAVQVKDYDGATNCCVLALMGSPDAADHLTLAEIDYSSLNRAPDIIAPDSICYYSESTGRGFSNASNDLAMYFDANSGKNTGLPVSIIKVEAAVELYRFTGVVASFAGLLRNIGYAGALPYAV